jgi:hypothetical protein
MEARDMNHTEWFLEYEKVVKANDPESLTIGPLLMWAWEEYEQALDEHDTLKAIGLFEEWRNAYMVNHNILTGLPVSVELH